MEDAHVWGGSPVIITYSVCACFPFVLSSCLPVCMFISRGSQLDVQPVIVSKMPTRFSGDHVKA